MEIWAAAVAVVGAGAAVYSAVQSKRGADAAGRTSVAVADYNSRVDAAEAAQIDLDTRANISAMRKDASVYMSRQTAGFVGAGVMANSGSALAVKVSTAAQLALRQQQEFAQSEARQRKLGSEAAAGIAEGAAKSDMYHMEGIAAVANGAANVSRSLYGSYKGGAFSSFGGGTAITPAGGGGYSGD